MQIKLSNYPIDVRLAAHAIGLDNKNPYERHGKFYYKPYRNYYHTKPYCKNCNIWMALVNKKYANWWGSISNGELAYHFFLNEKGRIWLGDKLNITIYEEE